MTARMTMAEDRGAPVDEDGCTGRSSITMGGRGVSATDLLSFAAALRGARAKPHLLIKRHESAARPLDLTY